jgi:hypothetical protein
VTVAPKERRSLESLTLASHCRHHDVRFEDLKHVCKLGIDIRAHDGDSDLWEGTCGVAWSLSDGTPKENGMGWCPKCGEELVEYKAEDFDDVPDELEKGASSNG